MKTSSATPCKEKLEDVLKTVSNQFGLPLLFLDTNNSVFFSSDKRGALPDPNDGASPETETVSIPILFMNDMIGSLVVPAASEKDRQISAAAAYCVERFLKFETEIEDLTSEIVRVYDELSILYSFSSKLGSEMDVDTICRRVLEETGRFMRAEALGHLSSFSTSAPAGRNNETE